MALYRLQKHWTRTQHCLVLSSQVNEPLCLAAVYSCLHFFLLTTRFVVLLDNRIGDAGMKHIADMLKVNTTLTSLDVAGELCGICIFDQFSWWYLEWPIYCDIENEIGDDGVRDITEALKVNSTLVDIDLEGERNTSCVFVIHLSPIREQELQWARLLPANLSTCLKWTQP